MYSFVIQKLYKVYNNLHYSLIIMLVTINFSISGQEPFNVPMIDSSIVKIIDYSKNTFEMKRSSQIENTGFFNRSSVGAITNLSGGFSPSASLNLLQYRLLIFSDTTIRKGNIDSTRIYLPLLFISKMSLNYDSTFVATLSDILGFAGSPITIRLMPNYTIPIFLENNLTIGHMSDFRTILYQDPLTKKLQTAYGYYSSLGIKFDGLGEVRDEQGMSNRGKWSISFLASYVYTSNKIKSLILEDGNETLGGFEAIFQFVVFDSRFSRFNIFASVERQYSVTKLLTPWVFKFTIGN